MSINIACSAPNCTNPVIGQCTGYKKTCGKYYCREHSSDTLCFDCANKKAMDEHAELVYQEYLALAEKVSKEPNPEFRDPEFKFRDKKLVKNVIRSFSVGMTLLIVLLIIGIITASVTQEVSQRLTSFYIILMVIAFILIGWSTGVFLEFNSKRVDWIEKEKQKRISEKVSEINKEKQGFTEFWNTWVKQRKEEQAEKKRQALIGVLTVVGVIAAGAIAAGLSESEYDRTRRAVRDEINSR